MKIQRQTGKGKPTIWRWQGRFMKSGVDGLLRDKTRPSRKPPLPPDVVARVVEMPSTLIRAQHTVFDFIGITNPEVIAAEGVQIGPKQREKALEWALQAGSDQSPRCMRAQFLSTRTR